MGSAYKCDECGGLFDGKSENEVGYSTGTEFVSIGLRAITIKKTSDDRAEVCPQCLANMRLLAKV